MTTTTTTEREFSIVIERDSEGYYIASVPELRGCHTQARSLDTLMERIKEAIELCLEDSPELAATEFLGVQRMSVRLPVFAVEHSAAS
jgi:predicted RNase H-like HicB family nuclease